MPNAKPSPTHPPSTGSAQGLGDLGVGSPPAQGSGEPPAGEPQMTAEERLRWLVEDEQTVFYRYRFFPEPGFDYVSDAATVVTGYTPQEHYDDPHLRIEQVHPEDRALLERALQVLDRHHEAVVRCRRKDGVLIWTRLRNVAVRDELGRLVAIEGIARDVTADSRAPRLLGLVEAAPAIGSALTVDAVIRTVSDQARAIVGAGWSAMIYQAPDHGGRSFTARSGPGDDDSAGYSGLPPCAPPKDPLLSLDAALSRIRLGDPEGHGEPGARGRPRIPGWLGVPLVGRDGQPVGVIQVAHKRAGEFTEDDSSVLVVLAQLSMVAIENARLYEAVLAGEQRLQALVDASPPAILQYDLEGRLQLWSRAAEKLFGWTSDEVLGREPPMVGDEARAGFEALRASMAAGGILTNLEVTRRRRDGSSIPVALSAAPLRDREGQLSGFMVMLADISERRRLEERLARSQRMEAMGRLAGEVAHDFNNLLSAILGYAEILLDNFGSDDPRRAALEEVRLAGERGARLTSQLLAIGRRQLVQPVVVDLNQVVWGMRTMLSSLCGKQLEVRVELGAEPTPVRADPVQLEQVVMNLALNACDAMPEGGTLTIATASVDALGPDGEAGVGSGDEALSELAPGASRRWVVLTVTDTGEGMDEWTREHCVEPFFTTKGRDQGTGLGLAIVYGIVTQNHGRLALDSQLGRGTTVRVFLPRGSVAARSGSTGSAWPVRSPPPPGEGGQGSKR